MWTAEEKSYIWLDSFALDPTEKNALIEEAGGVKEVVKTFARFEERFVKKGKKALFDSMLSSLQGDSYFKRLQSLYEREGITCITRASEGYFASWKELPDAPCVLYVKGDATLLKNSLFLAVGSRKMDAAYKKICTEICEGLAGHFTLLTGVAEGGDEWAATAGLKKGKVVCVLAGGFGEMPKDGGDFIAQVLKKGALVSVCPYDTPIKNYCYERRNKLMSACAVGTLVLGAGEKSGALISGQYALQFGKPVFALPYAPFNDLGAGCNALIKKGAHIAGNLIDISSHFGINLKEQVSTADLTEDESRVYEGLKESGETHLNALSITLGIPAFKLVAVLAKLEVKGLVVKTGGNKYLAH